MYSLLILAIANLICEINIFRVMKFKLLQSTVNRKDVIYIILRRYIAFRHCTTVPLYYLYIYGMQ